MPIGRPRLLESGGGSVIQVSDDSRFTTASSLLVDGGINGAYTTPL